MKEIDTMREARDAAWGKCRKERDPYVGSDEWTVGEVGTYRGFFNLGYTAALNDAADRAIKWQVKICADDDWTCERCTECNQLRAAIMGKE